METKHTPAVEAQIKSILSCVNYDMRDAVEKDLRDLLSHRPTLLEVVKKVSALNPNVGEVGPGMLAHLVAGAQYALDQCGEPL